MSVVGFSSSLHLVLLLLLIKAALCARPVHVDDFSKLVPPMIVQSRSNKEACVYYTEAPGSPYSDLNFEDDDIDPSAFITVLRVSTSGGTPNDSIFCIDYRLSSANSNIYFGNSCPDGQYPDAQQFNIFPNQRISYLNFTYVYNEGNDARVRYISFHLNDTTAIIPYMRTVNPFQYNPAIVQADSRYPTWTFAGFYGASFTTGMSRLGFKYNIPCAAVEAVEGVKWDRRAALYLKSSLPTKLR